MPLLTELDSFGGCILQICQPYGLRGHCAPGQSASVMDCGGKRQRDPAFARTESFRINFISHPPESAVAAPALPAHSKFVQIISRKKKRDGARRPVRDLIFILRRGWFVLRGFGGFRGGFLGEGGGARHGRVFFDVAGDNPFGEFGRVVFVGVGHDGVQHMEGDAGIVNGLAEAGGGSGFFAFASAFALDGGFKGGDVRSEVGDEGGREFEFDQLGGERRGVGDEGAGGVEQFLVAAVARHVQFAVEAGGAEQDEGMCGFADGEEVVMQFQAQGGSVEDAAVGFFASGNLVGSETGGGGDGGFDEGELFAAGAEGGEIGGVFVAEGVHLFEGGEKIGFTFFHNVFSGVFLCRL